MNAEPRVMLATSFRAEQIQDKFVPGLNAIGVHVDRIVPVTFTGEIGNVDAVLFMFQFCGHSQHDKFKARAKAAGVKFILIEQQAANWIHVLRKGGLSITGRPITVAPLPKPAVLPPEPAPLPVDASPEPLPVAPEPFTTGLRAERAKAKVTNEWIAETIGVSAALVDFWASGKSRVAPDHYDALLGLFPDLAKYGKPEFTLRTRPRKVAAEPSPVVPIVPVELPLPVKATNGHKATPPPLAGLLRAARALGIEGTLTVEVDDGKSTVRVGQQSWHGTSPDAAVEEARASLDKRLAEAMRKMEEQRRAMQAAMAEIGGDHV